MPEILPDDIAALQAALLAERVRAARVEAELAAAKAFVWRAGSAVGNVLLLARSGRRARPGASGGLGRDFPGRRLWRIQQAL
jgi:hypothetical protein